MVFVKNRSSFKADLVNAWISLNENKKVAKDLMRTMIIK